MGASERRQKPFGCVRALGALEGHWWVAAHLGAGRHGDIQVAEDVLCVLVLHRLSQE